MFSTIQQAQVLISIAKTSNFKATSIICKCTAKELIYKMERSIGILLVNRNKMKQVKFIDDVVFGDCLTEYGKALVPFAAAYADIYSKAWKMVAEIHKAQEQAQAQGQAQVQAKTKSKVLRSRTVATTNTQATASAEDYAQPTHTLSDEVAKAYVNRLAG